ncbi:MAG TPA: glycosyltransferase family 1 protein [bacterium]|nr:glycosyltransferase family 1 protein [bacterium]
MITYGIDGTALLLPRPTGVERYVANVLRSMMKMPLTLSEERVVLYAPKSKPESLVLPEGWTWRELGFWLPKGWTHVRLSAELLMHPPDVFFNPAHEIPYLYRRAKVVTTVHDVVFRHAPAAYPAANLRRQEWAVKRIVKQAQAMLAVSEATKNDLIELYKVPAEKVTVTHLAPGGLGEAVSDAANTLRKYALTPGMYMMYVSRIEAKKNPQTLIRAFIELRRRYGVGHPLKLVLVGDPGFGGEDAKRLAQTSNCKDDILFLGYVPDAEVKGLLENALCFAFPSLGEGFGIPVLEAMVCGAPAVVSDLPVLHEVAGEAALFVPPLDVARWTVALDTMLIDQKRRAELVALGKERVKQFTWEKTATITWSVLRATAHE